MSKSHVCFLAFIVSTMSLPHVGRGQDKIQAAEAAAAQFIRDAHFRETLVYFDEQAISTPRDPSPNGILARHVATTLGEVSRALGSNTTGTRPSIVCQGTTSKCRMQGAKLIVATSRAHVDGSIARVIVRTQAEGDTTRSKSIHTVEYEVDLVRKGDGWSVTKTRISFTS